MTRRSTSSSRSCMARSTLPRSGRAGGGSYRAGRHLLLIPLRRAGACRAPKRHGGSPCRSAGAGRVARHGVDEPDRVRLIVRAVPDPTCAGDLVLPLLEVPVSDPPGRELVAKAVLAVIHPARVSSKSLPAGLERSRCARAELLPAVGSVAGREAKLPLAAGRRRRDQLPSALRQAKGHGAGTLRPSTASTGAASLARSSGSAWTAAVAFHSARS